MSQDLQLPRPARIYPSKRDGWIFFLLVAAQVLTMFIGIRLCFLTSYQRLTGLVVLGCGIFAGWILGGTYYLIDGELLVVRCGFLRWNLPLSEIQSVTSSRSLKSGPALSLDRLRIISRSQSGEKELLISPVEPREFLTDLKLSAPWIEIPGPSS